MNRQIAVSGCDLDNELCRCLAPGDKILLEANGLRLYSSLNCPVVDVPWTVVANGAALVVQHPNGIQLTLPQERLKSTAPAVFKIHDVRILPSDEFYVIPQFISHYMAMDAVGAVYKPPQAQSLKERVFDQPIRSSLFQGWSNRLGCFVDGWTDLGMSRFSLRCYLDLDRLEAVKGLNWDILNAMTFEEFRRIHAAFHWLPTIVKSSKAEDAGLQR